MAFVEYKLFVFRNEGLATATDKHPGGGGTVGGGYIIIIIIIPVHPYFVLGGRGGGHGSLLSVAYVREALRLKARE